MRSGVTASSDSLIQNAAVRLCEMRLPAAAHDVHVLVFESPIPDYRPALVGRVTANHHPAYLQDRGNSLRLRGGTRPAAQLAARHVAVARSPCNS